MENGKWEKKWKGERKWEEKWKGKREGVIGRGKGTIVGGRENVVGKEERVGWVRKGGMSEEGWEGTEG